MNTLGRDSVYGPLTGAGIDNDIAELHDRLKQEAIEKRRALKGLTLTKL